MIPTIDGDTAWVIGSSALVMIMTPGLGFFYGGLVKHSNILTTIALSFVTFAIVSLIWFIIGFSLVFAPSSGGSHFIGNGSHACLIDVKYAPSPNYGPTVPYLAVFLFQLKFAAITPALISGSICTRVRFRSFVTFVVLWSLVVYAPICHWVWNVNGWAYNLGAIDFAGGTVVHVSSGFSALAAAIVVGKRKDVSDFKPSNIPLVLLGTALLWFGWFGFNGGSALGANALAANACIVTNVSAAVCALTWMLMEHTFEKKISIIGFAVGAVVGLVAITPASGYVTAWASVVIGSTAACVVYGFVRLLRRFRLFDDTLDVFCCHGIGGIWGSVIMGLFSTDSVNPAAPNGVFYGNGDLLWKQAVIVVATAAWSFLVSVLLLQIIKRTIGLRVSEEAEKNGLDKYIFGEDALGFDLIEFITTAAKNEMGSINLEKNPRGQNEKFDRENPCLNSNKRD
jgi:ammonium transporter, Amt family